MRRLKREYVGKNAKNKRTILQSDCIMYVVIGLLSIGAFCSIFGIRVINPTYVDWLLSGGDLTQHYLGWTAFRNADWMFPLGVTDQLAYPIHTSVIFTDSIPIFALFFKALSPILPRNFQYFGLWGILCFVLQGILSARILRRFTNKRLLIVLCSILFSYTPVMIWRMYAHTALAGHWVILFALDMLFENETGEKFNKKWYVQSVLLGILSPSIHMYFLMMNGIVMVGVCLKEVLCRRKISDAAWMLVGYLVSALLVVFLLGGLSSGMQAESNGLGIYSFNLNALFNPQGWSRLFLNLPLYGGGQYEGFAYLGAGCILLLIIGIVLFFGNEGVKDILIKRWKVILPCSVVSLFTIATALSPTITLNEHVILNLKLPELVIKLWSVFRASGRTIWVLNYILILWGCITVCRMATARMAVLVLVLFNIVQIYDISGVVKERYQKFNTEVSYNSQLKENDFWSAIENTDVKHIVFTSPSSIETNHPLLYSFTDWAAKNKMTINTFYFARSISEQVKKNLQDALEDITPENLYVFFEANKMECLKYDLHYYAVDGCIIGSVEKIQGYEELDKKFFDLSWTFGNNQYMNEGNGVDTEEGRLLFAHGYSYGPYWWVPAGDASVEISGENLDKTWIVVYSQYGNLQHSFQIESQTSEQIRLSLPLHEDVDTLEILVQNNSEENILLKEIKLTYED